MLQLKRWLITIFIVLLVVAGLGFIKFTQIQAAIAFGESFPEASETVNAVKTSWSTYQPSVSLIGEVKPQQTVDVRNEVEGILTKVEVSSGAKVQQGDLLMQFNVDTELAQLDGINAQIELAKLDVKRFTNLLDVRASSREPLDRAKAQLAVSQARAREIKSEIDKLTLYAPITGTASIHDWQVGTFVPANTRMINIVGTNDAVWVDFNLPQIYANIDIGTQLNVSMRSLNRQNNNTVTATLVALDQQLSATSRTLLARAEISNPPTLYKPGVVVSVNLPIGAAVSAIPLPNQAIRYDTFGSYVFVLEKDDKGDFRAKRQSVDVLSKEADTSYIANGLEAGQTVATVGSAKLLPNLLTFVSSDNASR